MACNALRMKINCPLIFFFLSSERIGSLAFWGTDYREMFVLARLRYKTTSLQHFISSLNSFLLTSIANGHGYWKSILCLSLHEAISVGNEKNHFRYTENHRFSQLLLELSSWCGFFVCFFKNLTFPFLLNKNSLFERWKTIFCFWCNFQHYEVLWKKN